MTAFRAEIGLALAGVLFAGIASAQTPVATPATSAPQNLPGNAAPAAPPEAPRAPQNSAPIEVNSLGSPDGPAAGLLEPTNGGMAADIWSGSDRATIENLMAQVPLASPVYSVRSLARKLILTVADAPVGQAPHAFQTVRLKTLLSAGLVGEAAKLATQVQLKNDPDFADLQAEAILLGGSPADACSDATAARNTNSDQVWMQLRAYCYAVAGQGDLLDLTRGVMKAQGTDEKGFETLLNDALTRKVVPPADIHEPTAVDVFLMRQLGLPITTALAARFGQSASMLALRDPNNPPMVRADAAAQAVHTGWLSSSDLNAIADAQVFTPPQFANAETAATGLPFFLGQALIRQAVAHAPDDETRSRFLAVALREGRALQLLTVAVRMQERGLVSVIPTSHLHAYVPTFARALMLARQADAAERWRETLDQNGDTDRALASALAVELNLVAPNAGRGARALQALAWLAGNATSPQPVNGPDEQRYDAMAVLLCDALGEALPPTVSPAALLAQKWPGRVLPPATRKQLDDLRGQENRKGEAILTLLDAVGVLGPGDLTPDASAFLVRFLKSEGEGEAARALALDALLLYQPAS